MPPQAPTRRVTGKQPQAPPPPAPPGPVRQRLTKKTPSYAPPASSHPSKASNSNVPALQMARMEASYKMQAAGDRVREQLYADQWKKGGPNRRLTTKSAPRAQNATPSEDIVNRNDARAMSQIVGPAADRIANLPGLLPFPLMQALFAKEVVKRSAKKGMSVAQQAAVGAVLGMGLAKINDEDLYE